MKIRAFNLVPGAVIATEPGGPRVVERVAHDNDGELVRLYFARHDAEDEPDVLTLGFLVPVTLLGLTPNEADPDVSDIGTDFPKPHAGAPDPF